MKSNLRLIRRVQGWAGALKLYQHDGVGLLELIQVDTVIELRRYPSDRLEEVLAYVDQVQRNIDANPEGVSMPTRAKRIHKAKAKRTRRLTRNGMWAEGVARRAKLSAGGET
jgi:hypothetical protein